MARNSVPAAVSGYFRKYPFAPRYLRTERLRLQAPDGTNLSAWRLDGPPHAPLVVVLVHGFVNWSRTPAVFRFAQRLRRDVHVVVPDLRGHGQSGGRCTMGRDEPLDVEAAVQAAKAAHPGLPVVTLGISLGGAAALLHAGTFRGVDAVVAVSAPAFAGAVDGPGAARVQRYVTSPVGRIVLAALLRTRIAARCDGVPESAHVVAAIAPAFTLVVHDPDDWYFGMEHAERIHGWASEPKALWVERVGGHGTDLLTDDFADRLLRELGERLSPPPSTSR